MSKALRRRVVKLEQAAPDLKWLDAEIEAELAKAAEATGLAVDEIIREMADEILADRAAARARVADRLT